MSPTLPRAHQVNIPLSAGTADLGSIAIEVTAPPTGTLTIDIANGPALSYTRANATASCSWTPAEDVHVANVLRTGDASLTYFEQYAFAKPGRAVSGDYAIVPGQEDPRHEQPDARFHRHGRRATSKSWNRAGSSTAANPYRPV